LRSRLATVANSVATSVASRSTVVVSVLVVLSALVVPVPLALAGCGLGGLRGLALVALTVFVDFLRCAPIALCSTTWSVGAAPLAPGDTQAGQPHASEVMAIRARSAAGCK